MKNKNIGFVDKFCRMKTLKTAESLELSATSHLRRAVSSKVKPTKLQPSPALWVIPQYCETYHILLLLEKNVRGREMEGVNSAEFLKNNFSDWMFPTEFFRKNFGIFPMEYFRQNISGIFFLTECFRQNLSDKVFLTEFYPLLSNSSQKITQPLR